MHGSDLAGRTVIEQRVGFTQAAATWSSASTTSPKRPGGHSRSWAPGRDPGRAHRRPCRASSTWRGASWCWRPISAGTTCRSPTGSPTASPGPLDRGGQRREPGRHRRAHVGVSPPAPKTCLSHRRGRRRRRRDARRPPPARRRRLLRRDRAHDRGAWRRSCAAAAGSAAGRPRSASPSSSAGPPPTPRTASSRARCRTRRNASPRSPAALEGRRPGRPPRRRRGRHLARPRRRDPGQPLQPAGDRPRRLLRRVRRPPHPDRAGQPRPAGGRQHRARCHFVASQLGFTAAARGGAGVVVERMIEDPTTVLAEAPTRGSRPVAPCPPPAPTCANERIGPLRLDAAPDRRRQSTTTRPLTCAPEAVHGRTADLGSATVM